MPSRFTRFQTIKADKMDKTLMPKFYVHIFASIILQETRHFTVFFRTKFFHPICGTGIYFKRYIFL